MKSAKSWKLHFWQVFLIAWGVLFLGGVFVGFLLLALLQAEPQDYFSILFLNGVGSLLLGWLPALVVALIYYGVRKGATGGFSASRVPSGGGYPYGRAPYGRAPYGYGVDQVHHEDAFLGAAARAYLPLIGDKK